MKEITQQTKWFARTDTASDQMRILYFDVKPCKYYRDILDEKIYGIKIIIFYTLEIFSFGEIECRKSKKLLETL